MEEHVNSNPPLSKRYDEQGIGSTSILINLSDTFGYMIICVLLIPVYTCLYFKCVKKNKNKDGKCVKHIKGVY